MCNISGLLFGLLLRPAFDTKRVLELPMVGTASTGILA